MKKAKTSDGYFRETFMYEGKRYDVRAKTQRELWRKVDEKKRELETGVNKASGNMLVSKWFEQYLEVYKKPTVTKDTYEDSLARVRNHINPAIGSKRLKDVKPIDLQKILNDVADKSKSLVDKMRDLIKGAFRQARIDRVLIYDPAEALVVPKVKQGIGRPITEDERKHILRVCEIHPAGLWIRFMLYTGARPVETRTVTWEDVDLKRGRITLHSAKNGFGDRMVPINPELRPYLTGGTGLIFTNPTTGEPHNKTSLLNMWLRFRHALDIDMGGKPENDSMRAPVTNVAKDLVPYCLRHTCATDMYTAGVPVNTIREFMGHKDISTTTRVYIKLSDVAFSDAAELIAAFEKGKRDKQIIPLDTAQHKPDSTQTG